MTVLEVLERTGSRETKRITAYINEALREIAQMSPEYVDNFFIDVEDGVRTYDLPSNYGKILSVFQIYDTSKNSYKRIPMVGEMEVMQDNTTSSSSSSDTFTVI